jgi:hypothetical protein
MFPRMRRGQRAAAAAAVTLALAAGLLAGVNFGTAAAADHARAGDGTIVITAGGDRTANYTVGGVEGAEFEVLQGTLHVGECTTGADGKCDVPVPTGMCTSSAPCTVRQVAAPPGWFINHSLAVGPATTPATGVATTYSSISGVTVTTGGTTSVPVAAPNSPSLTARTGVWALSRDEPDIPATCGLRHRAATGSRA